MNSSLHKDSFYKNPQNVLSFNGEQMFDTRLTPVERIKWDKKG